MITIINLGISNVGSVLNMLRKLGVESHLSADKEVIEKASRIILPGVGAFDHAVTALDDLNLRQVLLERAAAGTPMLGICLGMQMLMDESEEGVLPGLGLISGKVRRLNVQKRGLKTPHMGWNRTRWQDKSPLKPDNEVDGGNRFYFVHSYYAEPLDCDDIMCLSTYGDEFVSGINRHRVFGVQFHPEKSHINGMALLRKFVSL